MTKKSTPSAKKKPLSPAQLAVCARLYALWTERKDALGLTQEQVAGDWKVHPSSIAHALNGRNAIGFEAMFRWAQLLRVHPYDIDPDFRMRLPADLREAVDNMDVKGGAVQDSGTNYPPARSRAVLMHEPRITLPSAIAAGDVKPKR